MTKLLNKFEYLHRRWCYNKAKLAMNTSEYSRISSKYLRGLILEADGQSYQDLFWSIAVLAFTNFQKVKPHGSKGDKKNDGYRKNEGIFYQVYAPENPKERLSVAVKKMIEDFTGLYEFWNDIEEVKEFYFVFNDKFDGSYPEIYEAIKGLGVKYNNITFGLFRADDLQRLFRELPPNKQMEIINLDSDDEILSFESIDKVAKHLQSIEVLIADPEKYLVPDFEEKIEFNHLSEATAALLKQHYENISEVEKYFSEADNKELKKTLQEKYTYLFKTALTRYGSPDNEDVADNIFWDILASSTSHSMLNSSVRKASISLMALYFEACDIYFEPK